MKNIRYTILLAFSLILLTTACEDFITEEPFHAIDTEYIYSSVEGLETGVVALYNMQRANNTPCDYSNGLRTVIHFRCGTDLGVNRTWTTPYKPENQAPDVFPDIKWTLPYQIIDKANALIVHSRNIDGDKDEINKVVAQARAIRGELYFDLFRMYTNIVLDTIPTTGENYDDPVVYEPADSLDVFKLINEDLDFAIANLDWDVPQGTYGQGVARHLKGKVAMWSGDWTEATEQFDAIITSGKYALVGVNEVFGQEAETAEAIYVYHRDKETGGTGGADDTPGGGPFLFSSVMNNRAYEIPGGLILSSLEYGGQSLGWNFPNDYLKSLYDQENDKRFSTYYYPDYKVGNNPDNEWYDQVIPESELPDNYRQHHWSLKKFHDEEKELATNDSWKDIVYYRYAETLLLGAEAHWRKDGENPASPKALEYINIVRERAGVEPFAVFDLESYLEESARELAFEGNRWFLLKRCGLLYNRVTEHFRTTQSNSTNGIDSQMLPYMIRLAIPQSQIDLMGPTFPQNPGY